MTGVTAELRPWQVEELARYLGGPIAEPPSHNLVRRGLLRRVAVGTYAITDLGRAVLAEARG